MNDWTQLENRLRSWKPRRPSRSIKARLFPQTAEGEPEVVLSGIWGWLAPALTVVMLAALVLARDGRTLAPWPTPAPTGLVAAAVLHSPNLVAFYAPKRHSALNAWPGATFEWTNEPSSITTSPPFLRTNGLIQ
jgi:hypothetical protein